MSDRSEVEPEIAEEERLLNEFAAASAELHAYADPFSLPGSRVVEDEWDLPIPLRQENQLRLLWLSAWDAFDVVRTLARRAAPSVLAQVRYLAETLGLVIWLLESDNEQRSRSLSLARAEIYDYRNVHSGWRERHEKKRQVIQEANEWVERLMAKVASEGITLVHRPGGKALAERSGLGRFAYDVLTDIGSHAGIGALLIFFIHPEENRFVMDIESGVLPRAYYLAVGFQLYGGVAIGTLGGLGLTDERNHVFDLMERQKENLRRVSHLVSERGDPSNGRGSPPDARSPADPEQRG